MFDETARRQRLGGRAGDPCPRSPPAGSTPLTIGGTFGENALVGDYVVSLDTYDELFQQQLDTFVFVKIERGCRSRRGAARSIEGTTEAFGNIEVQNQAAFREQQAGFINQLLGLVTALLAMAILIALFGIVNTLGLSIFERKRELGLLRAVGMGRTAGEADDPLGVGDHRHPRRAARHRDRRLLRVVAAAAPSRPRASRSSRSRSAS